MVKITLDFTIQDNQITVGPIQAGELPKLDFGEVQVVGTGGIDVSGATPGQMIIVKTVDALGKPTAWEAIDRTHGDGVPGLVVMPETNLEDLPGSVFENGDGTWYFDLPNALVAGKTYDVTANGVTYTVTARNGNDFSDDGTGVTVDVPGVMLLHYAASGLAEWTYTDGNAAFFFYDMPVNDTNMFDQYPVVLHVQETTETKKLDVKYLDMDAIKASLPSVDMVATFDDGSTGTFKLYGEAVTE